MAIIPFPGRATHAHLLERYAQIAEEAARASGRNLNLDIEGVALPPEIESLLAQELINAVCDGGMSDSIKYV